MNRGLICFCLSVLLPPLGYAQSGFSKTYDFEARAAAFTNCILVGDTVVITGSILPAGSNQWSAMLARMDTNGQLIDLHYYPDTMGDHFTQLPNVDIINTSDGGYMMLGAMYSNAFGAVVKIDKHFNLEFYKKYSDDKYFSPKKSREIFDSYLILGTRQRSNFFLDTYIMKIDKNGNILWDSYLGDSELDESGGAIMGIEDNQLIIGGSSGIFQPSSFNGTYIQSKMWLIDSMGNQQWTWQSTKNIESGILGLQRLPNSDWLYCTRTYEVFGPLDWGGNCKIVRRDSNMNLLWEKIMPHATTPSNLLYDLKPTPDGNWVAVGNWIPFYTENLDSVPYLAGVLHKFSPQGDSIWTVLDTAFWHPIYGSENRLGGAVVLPSGSVISVGNSTNFYGQFKSWAWMLKVNNDGCVDTLCTVSGTDEPPTIAQPTRPHVFPNPADGFVQFQWPTGTYLNELTITDVTGQVVLRSVQEAGQILLTWNTTQIASGIYFYEVHSRASMLQSGKIIVHH